MHALLKRLGGDLLHVIAPAICPACDAPLASVTVYYCDACRASLDPAPFPRDLYTELLGRFNSEELALSSMLALYTFTEESPVQRLVHALKYQGCFDLGVQMGGEIGRATEMFVEFDRIEVVVPVPLHRARRRERGYNQAEAIGHGIAGHRGIPIVTNALTRARHTGSQTILSSRARLENVRQAFTIEGDHVRERVALLCDDVCTTGATLNACADALLLAGAREVYAATFAKDVLTPAAGAAH